MLRSFSISSAGSVLQPNVYWLCERFDKLCVLNSNSADNGSDDINYDWIVAAGAADELVLRSAEGAFEQLQEHISKSPGWLFGYLAYDLKNDIEKFGQEHRNNHPMLHFFSPYIVITSKQNRITVHYDDVHLDASEAEQICHGALSAAKEHPAAIPSLNIRHRMSREKYLEGLNSLKAHIRKGDIYEINFCMEFLAEGRIDPADTYVRLNNISRAPFSAFARFSNLHVICSSPERYLRKEGNRILSQPIKGTIRRSADRDEDKALAAQLRADEKERSENIMIVDLVRNDLSRFAERGSVNVDELCTIRSYKQVHQMVSTVSCTAAPQVSHSRIFKSTFPMGSMTGAPKVRAIELIGSHEQGSRGIYSGALGYIDPDGNMDMNVIIRTIIYDALTQTSSFMAGSAITDKSDPEKEYAECLLKAKAMSEVLQG